MSAWADMMTATISLSGRHTAAPHEAQWSQLVAGGWAVHGMSWATPETVAFLLLAVAGTIASAVILRSGTLSSGAAYVGRVAGIVTVTNDGSIVIAPRVAPVLMPVNGLLWLVWWLVTGRELLLLARRRPGVRT